MKRKMILSRVLLLSQDNGGAAVVEVALATGFILYVIFAGIYLTLVSYQKSSLSFALNRGLRSGAITLAQTEYGFYNSLVSEAERFGISGDSLKISFCKLKDAQLLNCPADSRQLGGSGEFTLVHGELSAPKFFGRFGVPVKVTAVRRFE